MPQMKKTLFPVTNKYIVKSLVSAVVENLSNNFKMSSNTALLGNEENGETDRAVPGTANAKKDSLCKYIDMLPHI